MNIKDLQISDIDAHNEISQPRPILSADSLSQSSVNGSGSSSHSVPRHPKRRAPITGVACQDCRKRKTKCDGGRPQCSCCAKRGIKTCHYDAEGTQSNKIAIYKSKIESQVARIAELEDENARLKVAMLRRTSSSNCSLPAPFQSMSVHSGYTQRSPTGNGSPTQSPRQSSSPSNVVSSYSKSVPDEPRSFVNSGNLRKQDVAESRAHSEGMAHTIFSARDKDFQDELANQETQKRSLHYENNRLKELMVFLTTLNDRVLAERMALRIRDDGLTDNLLCEANALYAAGRTKSTQPHVVPGPGKLPTLPALSSLDLPTLSASHTPQLDPELQNHSYSLPPLPKSSASAEKLYKRPWNPE